MEFILKALDTIGNTVLPFILLLGILVFVHELGHFLVARACGVRVEVFSLGFGKKLLQYRRGHTNYCISLIPLGGYVKMFGEQPGDAISPELKNVSFTHKHVLKRMAIVLAGPIMNFLFAIFIFGLVSILGEEKKPSVVGDLNPSTIAFNSGFRPGDQILSVSGQPVKTWDQLQKALNSSIGQEVDFELKAANAQDSKIIKAQVVSAENPNPLATSKVIGSIEGLQPISKGTHIGVLPNSVLSSLGVKTGDKIVAIGDKPVNFWRELEPLLKENAGNPNLAVSFSRELETKKPEQLTVNFKMPKEGTFASLGIEPTDLYLAEVIKGSPAQKAGLQRGDRLVEISSKKLNSWDDVLSAIKTYDSNSGALHLTIDRSGEEKKLEIVPQMTSHMNHLGKEEKRFTIGISPLMSMASEKSLIVKAPGVGAAFQSGLEKSYDFTVMTVLSFVRLIEGEISPKNVGGVISIGSAASESFKAGTTYFMQMMGIISISLFVLNLLPIPVLDGGHLVFYTIEFLKGSPLSLRNMELAQQVGLVLLMSLMLFALYNDFSRLLGLY